MNVVANNILAINAQRQYKVNIDSQKKHTEKISSGYRVNRASDDAAGLAISEKMRQQIRGLNRGTTNIQDGISLVQVADGALSTVHDLLHRMNELATQAANDTNTDLDRDVIQKELESLSSEIDRIGRDTTFNTMHIFDDMYGQEDAGSITKLVSCPSAEKGYFAEAIQIRGGWMPSASLDFGNITEKSVKKLNDGGFSFNCSRGCDEVFDFTFKTDGTPSGATNLNGKVHHYYTVDISNCKTGTDIVNAIYDVALNNLPYNNDRDAEIGNPNTLPGAIQVSHSNYMIKSSDGNGLIIYPNRTITLDSHGDPSYITSVFPTEQAAKDAYPSQINKVPTWAGGIDCTRLDIPSDEEIINEFNIQCSSNPDDREIIRTRKINATVLGVTNLKSNPFEEACKSMTKAQNAIDMVSEYRAELGAYQNRLEHSYDNVRNNEENTQAAESRIRDTDMAKEMVALSISNIVAQAGQSVIAQANQTPQGVLSLLQ